MYIDTFYWKNYECIQYCIYFEILQIHIFNSFTSVYILLFANVFVTVQFEGHRCHGLLLCVFWKGSTLNSLTLFLAVAAGHQQYVWFVLTGTSKLIKWPRASVVPPCPFCVLFSHCSRQDYIWKRVSFLWNFSPTYAGNFRLF